MWISISSMKQGIVCRPEGLSRNVGPSTPPKESQLVYCRLLVTDYRPVVLAKTAGTATHMTKLWIESKSTNYSQTHLETTWDIARLTIGSAAQTHRTVQSDSIDSRTTHASRGQPSAELTQHSLLLTSSHGWISKAVPPAGQPRPIKHIRES